MKQFVLAILMVCSFGSLFGQEELTIDFDSIKAAINKTESDHYYPTLLKRFNDFDSTLSLQEYSLIYYGFSFQDDYLKNQPDEKVLIELLDSKNYGKIASVCQKILRKNPVSLLANNEMGFALFKLHKPESEWKKYQKRYRAIRKVIAYSGYGMKPETAFKVIYVSDEYNLLYDYFNIVKIEEQGLVGNCDKFIVEPSDYYNFKEVYFDISRKLIRQEQLKDHQ